MSKIIIQSAYILKYLSASNQITLDACNTCSDCHVSAAGSITTICFMILYPEYLVCNFPLTTKVCNSIRGTFLLAMIWKHWECLDPQIPKKYGVFSLDPVNVTLTVFNFATFRGLLF